MPDKMYIHRTFHLGLWAASEFPVDAPNEKEYVSKDALLDWINENHKKLVDVRSDYREIYNEYFKGIIDKLNSL